MFGFGRKPPAVTDTRDQLVIPIGLDERHRFIAPTRESYPSPPVYGTQVYAPHIGTDLPPIANQDRILVHWYRPPDIENPARWWADNNAATLHMGLQEHAFTKNPIEYTDTKPVEDNPWLHTPRSPRPTSTMSPSNYRFIRPFDQRWVRDSNRGNVFSAAQISRSYGVGGMQPQNILRNTFRLTPSARDLENVDLDTARTAAVEPAVYVSPQQQSSRWGL